MRWAGAFITPCTEGSTAGSPQTSRSPTCVHVHVQSNFTDAWRARACGLLHTKVCIVLLLKYTGYCRAGRVSA